MLFALRISRRFVPAISASIAGIALTVFPLAVAYASTSVSIQSLSPSTTVSVGTNLSFVVSNSGFTNPTYSISDSLSGSSVGNGNINSSGDFSWTPNSNDVGTHNLTITVSDSQGDSATTQESIVVTQAPSVSIQSLSPSTNITSNQTLTFNVVASGFTNPTYSVSDSFSGGSVSNSNINSNGNFSWTPGSNDVGTHTITVDVNDSSGHSISANETITVTAAGSAGTTGTGGATIQGLSPGSTVVVGNPVTFTVAASGFSSPVFSVSDSFSGGSVSNSDINTAGYFSWTPGSYDVGVHAITIYVNDSSGHSGNVTLSLTVQTPNITVISITPGTTVTPNSALSFQVTPAGFVNPSYTVSDSFSGTSISNSNINSSGYFNWTPASSQDGTHTITVYATDSSGHSANTSITINVNSGVSLALTALSPGTTIAPGTTATLVAYPYGFTSPAYSVSDSFSGSSISSADVNSSGSLTWTPTVNDIGSHTITITATDEYGHTASAQTTVTVTSTGTTATAPAGSVGALETELEQVEAQIASVSAQGGSSSGSSGFVFNNDLALGDTSTDVTQLQTALTNLGFYSGPITGYYGSLTEASVQSFQKSYGIEQLGVVGPQTRAELNTLLSGSTTTSAATSGNGYVFDNFIGYGSTGTDVTQLQTRLTTLGFYSGPVTGYFGTLTQAAVEKFQGSHGIEQVGYVGPATRDALNQ